MWLCVCVCIFSRGNPGNYLCFWCSLTKFSNEKRNGMGGGGETTQENNMRVRFFFFFFGCFVCVCVCVCFENIVPSRKTRFLQTGSRNLNTRRTRRTCDVMHIEHSSPISVMQRPTQPTALILNSARQPVTQSQVALVHTFATCDERGDSF